MGQYFQYKLIRSGDSFVHSIYDAQNSNNSISYRDK
jgi:hypothetical protein